MRQQLLTTTLLLTLVMLPGSAALAQALEADTRADCQGWAAMVTLNFPAGVFSADFDYSVVLTDQDGAELDRFEWAGQLSRFENPVMIRTYEEPWTQGLAADGTARLAFHFLGEEVVQTVDLACGPAEPEPDPEPVVLPCAHTYKYWRKHPERWPVEELMVGDRLYSQDQLLRLMRGHRRFQPAFALIRPLIAAKLNLASGTDESIVSVVEAADALLAGQTEHRRCRGRINSEVRSLKRDLVAYNNQPCAASSARDDVLLDKTFADEAVTFDGMKAMYR